MSKQKKNNGPTPAKRVTLKDIAAKCDVCVMTVSCALRGDRKMVSQQTIDRIRKVAREMGYRYDLGHSARRLKYTSSEKPVINHLIGMNIGLDAMTSPYFTRLLSVISRELYKVDFSILTGWSGQVNTQNIPIVFKRGDVDGVLNMAGSQNSEKMLGALRSEPGFGQRPIVSIMEPLEDCPAILCDEKAGARALAKYLFESGHRQILVPSGAVGSWQGKQRLAAMSALFEEHGVDPKQLLITFEYTMQMGSQNTWETIRKAMADHPDARVIFAGNDLVAVRICEALRTNGMSIPEDISVVGYDGTHAVPGEGVDNVLTTVAVPLEDVAFKATRMLLDLIHDKITSPETIILPEKLEIRSSVTQV